MKKKKKATKNANLRLKFLEISILSSDIDNLFIFRVVYVCVSRLDLRVCKLLNGVGPPHDMSLEKIIGQSYY